MNFRERDELISAWGTQLEHPVETALKRMRRIDAVLKTATWSLAAPAAGALATIEIAATVGSGGCAAADLAAAAGVRAGREALRPGDSLRLRWDCAARRAVELTVLSRSGDGKHLGLRFTPGGGAALDIRTSNKLAEHWIAPAMRDEIKRLQPLAPIADFTREMGSPDESPRWDLTFVQPEPWLRWLRLDVAGALGAYAPDLTLVFGGRCVSGLERDGAALWVRVGS